MYILGSKVKWNDFLLVFVLLLLTMVVPSLKVIVDAEIGNISNSDVFNESPSTPKSYIYISGILNVLSITFAAIFGSVASKSYLSTKPSLYVLKQNKKIARNYNVIYDSAYKFESHILGYSVSKSFKSKKYLQSILIKHIDRHLMILNDIENQTRMSSVGIFSIDCRDFWYAKSLELLCYENSFTTKKISEFREMTKKQAQKEKLFFESIAESYKITGD